MIPKECKRLAEVDFPIAEVSKHAAREKSIRHGHPSTLHLWWARRPLASSRAVLMALLLPDPCDPNCPEEFKKQASEILREVRQPPKSDRDLQKALLWFIGSFANWDMSSQPVYIKVARNLVLVWRRTEIRRRQRETIAARLERVSSTAKTLEREETRCRIANAVATLTVAQRRCIVARYFDELPPREIATRLGVPLATVRSRLRRGLRQLRNHLQQDPGLGDIPWHRDIHGEDRVEG